VLLHCWFGHLTCKIVSEMTYNVSSGTLNPTIPYHLPLIVLSSRQSGLKVRVWVLMISVALTVNTDWQFSHS